MALEPEELAGLLLQYLNALPSGEKNALNRYNFSLRHTVQDYPAGYQDPISVPMQYATASDGVRIAYVSLGDGPPLVFASNIFGELNGYRIGWPHTREVTDRLVGLGWRVIRYDVRGMGSSDRDVEDLSLL